MSENIDSASSRGEQQIGIETLKAISVVVQWRDLAAAGLIYISFLLLAAPEGVAPPAQVSLAGVLLGLLEFSDD